MKAWLEFLGGFLLGFGLGAYCGGLRDLAFILCFAALCCGLAAT